MIASNDNPLALDAIDHAIFMKRKLIDQRFAMPLENVDPDTY